MITTKKIVRLLGILSTGMGLLSLCGYMAGSPGLYTWAKDHPMSLNTAILDTVEGIAIYIIGTKMKNN